MTITAAMVITIAMRTLMIMDILPITRSSLSGTRDFSGRVNRSRLIIQGMIIVRTSKQSLNPSLSRNSVLSRFGRSFSHSRFFKDNKMRRPFPVVRFGKCRIRGASSGFAAELILSRERYGIRRCDA